MCNNFEQEIRDHPPGESMKPGNPGDRFSLDSLTHEQFFKDELFVDIVCSCGYENTFASHNGFRQALGEILHDDPFVVRCPDCKDTRISRTATHEEYRKNAVRLDLVADINYDAATSDGLVVAVCPRPCWHVFSIGTTEEGPARVSFNEARVRWVEGNSEISVTCPECATERLMTGWRTNDAGSDTYSLGSPYHPCCPSCGAPEQDLGYKTGPEKPEIGWEYYACPECGKRSRVDNLTNADQI